MKNSVLKVIIGATMFAGSLVALLVHRHPIEIVTLGLGAALFLMGWGEVMDANPNDQQP